MRSSPYTYAITVYAKSKIEQENIQRTHNVLHVISLQEISLYSLKNLIHFIRSLSGRLLIYLSDANERTFLNVMLGLFIFSLSFKIDVIEKENRKTYNKLTALFPLILSVGYKFWAVILIVFTYLQCYFYKSALKISPAQSQDNPQVLYLKTNFWVSVKAGGSVGHVAGIIAGLKNKGYNVTYAGLDQNITMVPQLPIIPLVHSTLKGELNAILFDFSFLKQIKKQKGPDKFYDFIYHRLSLNSLAALKYARRHHIPFVVEYNGSEIWAKRHWGKPLFFERFSQKIEDTNLFCADLIVTISTPLKDELVKKGIPLEKIALYPNCVNPDIYDSQRFSLQELSDLRHELGLSSTNLVFTFIGTFGKWHGVDFLVETLIEFQKKHSQLLEDHGVKILLIGDGDQMPYIRSLILHNPSLEKIIILAGLIEQNRAVPYLALSDVFLSPHPPQPDGQKFFGSPTKLFEYMSMAKPIIASDLEQQGEILKDITPDGSNPSITLFQPGNREAFMEVFSNMIINYNQVKPYAHKSREAVLSKYTWDIHVQQILDRLYSPV